MEAKKSFPVIYIMSKFTEVPAKIKKYLPDDVNIIHVKHPDINLNTYEIIQIPDEIVQVLQKAEILFTDTTCLAYLLYRLPNVKWVQIFRAGVEQITDELDRSKPLPQFTLTRYVDSSMSYSMANYVLGEILNVERRLFYYHEKQKLGEWVKPNYSLNIRLLSELTIGLLGAGKIGSTVGELLKSCGCRVIAFVRNKRNGPSKSYDVAVTDLEVVLKESDYFCNILPSTKNTRGLLDNDVLKNCKKNSVFINIGRGDVIRNSSIAKALKEEWISGAILDVFEKEPLPAGDALWSMPKVHITPHVGALPNSEQIAQATAENYMKYVKGETQQNVIDWESGY